MPWLCSRFSLRPAAPPETVEVERPLSPSPTTIQSQATTHSAPAIPGRLGAGPVLPELYYVNNKLCHALLVYMWCHRTQYLHQVWGWYLVRVWSCLPGGNHKTICKLFSNTGLNKKVEMLTPEGLRWNVCVPGYRPSFILALAQRTTPGLCKDMGGTETTAHTGGVGGWGWCVHVAPTHMQEGQVWDMDPKDLIPTLRRD